MRTIIFTKGIMGSGKSTFLKNAGLEPWVISSDKVRLLLRSPSYTEYQKLDINVDTTNEIFALMRHFAENRMKNRELVIIDSTNLNLNMLQPYHKLITKYRYKAYVLDFSHISLEQAKINNKNRLFEVPEHSIDNAYTKLLKSTNIPSWLTVIKPDNFMEKINYVQQDFSNWKKIHHIGDIHGCATVLHEYLNGHLNPDELYIFLGDYIERGIENHDALSILKTISNKPNVILLEGNHEINIHNYANNEEVSHYFKKNTQKEIECFDKKVLRNFYRKLRPFVYYKYHDKDVLVSHGGLTFLPKEFITIPETQFIRGIGGYDLNVGELWDQNTQTNQYQVHGHRNIYNLPINNGTRNFVLEGQVEFGKHLRVLTLDKNGFHEHYLKNNVFNSKYAAKNTNIELSPSDFLTSLRENDLIREKKQNNNISSFNFKRNVFWNNLWDKQTVKARGLFINTHTKEIVARSYDKFFNLGELEQHPNLIPNNNSKKSFCDSLCYPIDVYQKENGFLGITGFDAEFNQPIIASKSTVFSDFANWFKNLLKDKLKEKYDDFFNLLKEKNISAVFEVVDTINDPHYIEYNKSNIYLLDIIYRQQQFSKLPYDELVAIAEKFGLTVKTKVCTINSKEELETFIKNSKVSTNKIEGYVLEDKNGFMFKIKLPYYLQWKTIKRHIEKFKKISDLQNVILPNNLTSFETNVLQFVFDHNLINKSIIEIQNIYYKNNSILKYLVTREDGIFEVALLPHKINRKYSYVNLTKGHICPCEFDSIEEALEDMNSNNKVLSYSEIH